MKKIPEGWEVVRLGEVVDLLRNGLVVKQSKEKGEFPITRIETISNEKIDTTKLGYVTNLDEKLLNAYRMIKGDVLFSHINSLPHIGKTGIYEGYPQLLMHGMNLLLLRANYSKLNSKFLLYLFRLYRNRGIFKSMAKTAVNQASINQTELANLKIPLPPLPEQERIAEILSTVDEAIEKVGQKIEKTEGLKKGLMQKLLTEGIGHKEFKDTEIGKIPKEWKLVRLGETIGYVKGKKPYILSEEYKEGYFPYLSTEYLRNNGKPKFAVPNDNVVLVEDADLILLWDGSNAGEFFMGKKGILSSTMVKIQLKKDINTIFLFYLLKTKEKGLSSQTRGTGIPHVDKNVLEDIKIPLPPLPEQEKIAEILSTVDRKLELEKRRKEKLERIKKGLMEELLTGKKRVKV